MKRREFIRVIAGAAALPLVPVAVAASQPLTVTLTLEPLLLERVDFISTRHYMANEIARIYRVPPRVLFGRHSISARQIKGPRRTRRKKVRFVR